MARFKAAVAWLHRGIDRSALVTGWYLQLWLALLRCFRGSPLKDRVVANLSLFPWRLTRLPALTTGLDGSAAPFRVVPHPGMMDFHAAAHRRYAYEPEVVQFLEGHLAEIDHVVEIGANAGLYTLYFARRLAPRGGRVFAFEPGARAFRALLDNLQASGADNVVPLNAAVYERSGLATFYEPVVADHGFRDVTRSSLVEEHARWNAKEVREYPVLTVGPDVLDALFRDRGRVLVKLDIEGAEQHVLRAIEPLLRRYRPAIVMEALHNTCPALNELAFLPEIYQLYHLTDAGPIQHQRFEGDPNFVFKDYFLAPRWH
jgi:FkbM family methyltransferase